MKDMKKVSWIMILLSGILACTNNSDRADAYGNFEATEVLVSAMARGELLSLNIEEGQVVGLIDSTDIYLKKKQLFKSIEAVRASMSTIDARMEVQKQQRKNLLVDRARLEKLFADEAATQKQLDDIRGAIDLIDAQIRATSSQKEQVQAEIEALRIQIDQVEESLSKCRITNTAKGTVLVKYAEAGEVTAPGKPLYKIADLETMKLKVYVSGEQLPHIRIGQEVEVQIDKTRKENSSLRGRISWISSTAEFTPKTIQTKEERVNLVYAVRVLVTNDGAIKIGMPGEVYF
jgi:HlyD family secretion protein